MLFFKNFKKTNITKDLPFDEALQEILGRSYRLELVFTSSETMKTLNKTYRGEDKTTNVLSFALDEYRGQIFFDADLIRKEAKAKKITFKSRLWYLFLHGVLHLAGFDHEGGLKKARNMQIVEARLLKKYSI